MTNKLMSQKDHSIPFRTELNLKYLIEYWFEVQDTGNSNFKKNLDYIRQTINEFPFLKESITDPDSLKSHRKFIDILTDPLISNNSWSHSYSAIAAPFSQTINIKTTDAFKHMIADGNLEIDLVDPNQIYTRTIYAYKAILKHFYQLEMRVELPIINSFKDKSTGLTQYFKLLGNNKFTRVLNTKPLPQFDKSDLKQLLENKFDISSWNRILPLNGFLFSGLVLVNYIDITVEEATRKIQYHLAYEEGNEKEWLEILQREVRILLRIPDVRLGIATIQKNGKLNLNSTRPRWNSLIIAPEIRKNNTDLKGSIYHEVLNSGKTIIFEDLSNKTDPFCNYIKERGFSNLILTPLVHGGEIVGILELICPRPGSINALSLFKINQLKPVFANSLKAHQEEFENRVEAEMLEKFTTIHPTIKWRFRDAAISSLEGKYYEHDIIFKDLYPYYGSLDIRNSSKFRNHAISQDLRENLNFAQQILTSAYEDTSIPFLDELTLFCKEKINQLNTEFSTETEILIAEFIRNRITPGIRYLCKQNPQVAKGYFDKLDNETGIFTRNRKLYEQSLHRINSCISKYLDNAEKRLLNTVPCIFNKLQTDGVEYNVYLGNSLTLKDTFEQMYIDDVRLRQIKWTYEIMKEVNKLQLYSPEGLTDSQPETIDSFSLQIAPLILSYGSTVTLKFDKDEKLLDVDGTYNVRYEIMKKRIDKARISGTNERLTQPNHIAIVYSRSSDADIYRKHFHYMASLGHFPDKWEELELEPLAGVEGLKALRIKPNL